jgi:4-amino-4-deoxy-L-arabinose transferase-like glycosyltransferase
VIGGVRGSAGILRVLGLGLLLLAYALLTNAYRAAIPMGEGPDEPGHIAYVSFLRAHGRPPRHGEVGEPLKQQVKHPPLYYALGVLATWGQDDTGLLFAPNPQFSVNFAHQSTFTAHRHTVAELPPRAPRYEFVEDLRRLSLWLGLITVLATVALALTIVPDGWAFALTAGAIVAFLPQFLFMSSVANNDALAIAAGSLTLLAAARVAVRPPRRRAFIWLGLTAGLGLLAKLTTLAMLPVAVLSLAIAAWRMKSWRVLGRGAVWAGGTLALVTGAWIAWNVTRNGDVLGWAEFTRAAGESLRTTPLLPELPIYLAAQFQSFLGRFGWMSVGLPDYLYTAFGGLVIVAIVGLIVQALAVRRGSTAGTILGDPATARWGVGLLWVALALVYVSVFRLAFTFNLVVAQGRYLFPALAAFGVLFVLGVTGWLPSRVRGLSQCMLAVAWFGLGLYGLVGVLGPAFAPIMSSQAAAQPPKAVQASFIGSDGVKLLGTRCPAVPRLVAGTVVDWPITWMTGEQQSASGLVMFTQLVDGAGHVLAQDDRLPLDGHYPSSAWLPGREFTETVRLQIPAVDAARRATVMTGWYRDNNPAGRVNVMSLTVGPPGCTVNGGSVLADQQAYGWPVVVTPAEPATVPAYAKARGDTFGQPTTVRLVGVNATAGHSEGGSRQASVQLYWQAEAPDAQNRTVFVHLLDDAGRLVVAADSQPEDDQYPTSFWQAGEIVPDTHALSLPPDLPAGRYQLVVGWYDLASGTRQPARDAAGKPWPDDGAVVGKLAIDGAGVRLEALP